MIKNRDFMSEKILRHHPDLKKFTKMSSVDQGFIFQIVKFRYEAKLTQAK